MFLCFRARTPNGRLVAQALEMAAKAWVLEQPVVSVNALKYSPGLLRKYTNDPGGLSEKHARP